MTRHEAAALNLAREIVRLLDLWNATDGEQGAEDVEDAICAAADAGDRLAESLVELDTAREEDVVEDSGGAWLDACHRYGLLDTAPDDVPSDDGCVSGLIYWSGFGSEQAIRRAVRS